MSKANDCIRMNQELLAVLDTLLATEGWDAGILLQVSKKKLMQAREATQALLQKSEDLSEAEATFLAGLGKPGHLVVYVVLHQAEGNDLNAWYGAIKALEHHSFGRPMYLDQDHAKRTIAAKRDSSREAYLSVYIQASDIVDRPAHRKLRDNFGQELVTLRHGAFEMQNVIELALADGRSFIVQQGRLVLKTA